MRNPLKKLGQDFLLFGRDLNDAAAAVDQQRKAPGTTTHNSASWVAQTSFPIYVEHTDLPAGTTLVSLTKTTSGVCRTIELPAWSTRPVDLRELRRSHAKWTDGGIDEEMVRVRRVKENARRIRILTTYDSAFGRRSPDMPKVDKNRIPIGYNSDGEIQWLSTGGHQARHAIVAGMTGSGKSNTMEHLMGCFVEQGCELWLGDPTGGSEFLPFEDLASTVAYTAEDCSILLTMAVEEIKRRYAELGESRQSFWTGQPLVVFIDELPQVLDKSLVIGVDAKGKDIKQGVAGISAMKTIVMRGRRAGVSLIVGIQSARAEDMSGAARSQFPTIICHKVQRSAESTIILGDGAIEEGLDARRLPMGGRAYLVAVGFETDQVQIFKARAVREVAGPKRSGPVRIVAGGFGAVAVENREGTGELRFRTVDGTTVRESPQETARKAALRLSEASSSKWATPILEALADAEDGMGISELARSIVGPEGQACSKGSVFRVLGTLKSADLVEECDAGWCLTELGEDLVNASSVSDFYGEDHEE